MATINCWSRLDGFMMTNEKVYAVYIYISIVDVHVTCTVCVIDCSRLLTLCKRSILVILWIESSSIGWGWSGQRKGSPSAILWRFAQQEAPFSVISTCLGFVQPRDGHQTSTSPKRIRCCTGTALDLQYSLAFFHYEGHMKLMACNCWQEGGPKFLEALTSCGRMSWLTDGPDVSGPGQLHMSFSPPTPFFLLTLMRWWATRSSAANIAVIKAEPLLTQVLSFQISNAFLECFLHPSFGQFERISSSLQVSPSDWCRRAARVSTIHKSWLFLRSSRTGIAVCTTFVAVAFLVELIVHGIGCPAETSLSWFRMPTVPVTNKVEQCNSNYTA